MLGIDQYPKCCGIGVINNFGGTISGSRRDVASADEVKRTIRNYIKSFNYGLYTLALNEDQVPLFGETVEAEGFKPVQKFFHKGHGKFITLYTYVRWTDKDAAQYKKDREPINQVTQAQVPIGGFTTATTNWFFTDTADGRATVAERVPEVTRAPRARMEVPLPTRGGERVDTLRAKPLQRSLRNGGTRPSR